MTTFNSGRRNVIHTFRTKTAAVIFNQPLAYFASNYDRQSLPQFAAAIYADPLRQKFSKYSPIIFPNGVRDMNNIFRAPHLPLVRPIINL